MLRVVVSGSDEDKAHGLHRRCGDEGPLLPGGKNGEGMGGLLRATLDIGEELRWDSARVLDGRSAPGSARHREELRQAGVTSVEVAVAKQLMGK